MRSLTSLPVLIAVSIAVPASATTIVLDPGSVGTSFRQQSFPLDDLIGVPFDGRGLDFNFVFGDMKHLELAFNDDDPTRNHRYAVELLLRHDLGATPPVPPFATGFLSDEIGASLLSPAVRAIRRSAEILTYSLSFAEPSADGVIHHGIRFEATLPAADALVTEASLGLLITSLEGEIRVGDWGRVPEPSTLFLITSGALGLVGLRRGMRRSRPGNEGSL